MIIEEKVFSLLSVAASITALVPATRIKPPGDWQNLARPYIVHFPVALSANYTHSGRAAMNAWPFYQVSCFADSYSEARSLAAIVAAALSGNHDGCQFFVRNQTALFDSEVKVHHVAVDFEIFESL